MTKLFIILFLPFSSLIEKVYQLFFLYFYTLVFPIQNQNKYRVNFFFDKHSFQKKDFNI